MTPPHRLSTALAQVFSLSFSLSLCTLTLSPPAPNSPPPFCLPVPPSPSFCPQPPPPSFFRENGWRRERFGWERGREGERDQQIPYYMASGICHIMRYGICHVINRYHIIWHMVWSACALSHHSSDTWPCVCTAAGWSGVSFSLT